MTKTIMEEMWERKVLATGGVHICGQGFKVITKSILR